MFSQHSTQPECGRVVWYKAAVINGIAYVSLSPTVPQVFFNVSEITVQESETREERARFHIRREGPDLGFQTEVSYRILLLPDDNATPYEDYVPLPPDGHCGEGVGCVRFDVGEEEVEQSVIIRPDRRREGNETLHIMLQSVNNGRIRNSTLQVTIIDATQRKPDSTH